MLFFTALACAPSEIPLGRPAEEAETPEEIHTDTGDASASEPACGGAGVLASEFDGFDQPGLAPDASYRASWALTGTGAVCAAACSVPWADVFLCDWSTDGGWIDGVAQPLVLPADVTSADVYGLCVAITPDGATGAGSCVVDVSGTAAGAASMILTFEVEE